MYCLYSKCQRWGGPVGAGVGLGATAQDALCSSHHSSMRSGRSATRPRRSSSPTNQPPVAASPIKSSSKGMRTGPPRFFGGRVGGLDAPLGRRTGSHSSPGNPVLRGSLCQPERAIDALSLPPCRKFCPIPPPRTTPPASPSAAACPCPARRRWCRRRASARGSSGLRRRRRCWPIHCRTADRPNWISPSSIGLVNRPARTHSTGSPQSTVSSIWQAYPTPSESRRSTGYY